MIYTINVAFGLIYRSSNSPISRLLELETVLRYIHLSYDALVLVSHRKSCQLSNILSQVNLTQIGTEFTGHSMNSATLIDVMYVDNNRDVIQCQNVDVPNETDDMMTCCELNIRMPVWRHRTVTSGSFTLMTLAGTGIAFNSAIS